MAVGAAIAERFLAARFGELFSHKTFAFISDGGVQEEISQGAGRLAGFLGLNNLVMFYDRRYLAFQRRLKRLRPKARNEIHLMRLEGIHYSTETTMARSGKP
jgi:transketolase